MIQTKLVTFLVAWLFAFSVFSQTLPYAKKGNLNAHAYDFSKKPLPLNGEWEFYQNELRDTETFSSNPVFILFPHQWDSKNSQGYATYKLRVLINQNKDTSSLALQIPQLYCAYSLWINDSLLAKNGIVGTTRKETQAQWLPLTVSFVADDTLDITLQISNFHHTIGGIKNPIYLGSSRQLFAEQQTSYFINTALLTVLSFIGLFFLIVYFFVKKQKSVLYFSLFCLTWALRSIFSEQYLAIHWMPWFDWELAVKIEYLTLYLAMMWAILFISNLYPLDTHKIIKRILLYPNYGFVFLTMATPALVYTNLLIVYLGFAGFLILYVVFVIMRAMAFARYGAWFSVIGIIALAAAFGYNYLSYQGFLEFYPIAFYSACLFFFLHLAVALAYQLSPKASRHNFSESLSFDDLMKK